MNTAKKLKTHKRTKSIGNKGELIAYQYFINKGFDVLDRNYRKRRGEVDLICKKDNVLHFIEVKTIKIPKNGFKKGEIGNRTNKSQLNLPIRPEDNLSQKKIQQVIKMAEIYRIEKKIEYLTYQIDAMAIYLYVEHQKIMSIKVRYIPNIHIL